MNFPLESFPAVIRDYAVQFAKASGAKPEFFCCGSLAVASSIGSGCQIRIKSGYREYLNLYIVIAGAPGVAKSQPLKKALLPLEDIMAQEWDDYEQSYREWDNRFKRAKNDEQDVLLENKPIPPVIPITTRATMEGLIDTLRHNKDAGFAPHTIYYKDELNAFFASMDAYREGRGGDNEAFLEFFNGHNAKITNKHEKRFISKTILTILGTIQTNVMRNAMQDKGNGLIERFIFAMNLDEPQMSDIFSEVPESTILDYDIYVRKIYQEFNKTLLAVPCELRDHVQEMNKHFFDLGRKHDTGAFKKWEQNFFKIIGCLTILWNKNGIDEDIITKAKELTKYFADQWINGYKVTNASREEVLEAELKRIIKKQKCVKHADLRKMYQFCSKNATSQQFNEAIENLMEEGLIERRRIDAKTKKVLVYFWQEG